MLLARAEKISPVLADYLKEAGWRTVWPRLQSNHQSPARRSHAFHTWFDGFRTMRLIHMLCDAGLCRSESEDALKEYFAWGERTCPGTLTGMLAELRLIDGVRQPF